jgi:hypothetical protein
LPTNIQVTTATKGGKPHVKITLPNGTQVQMSPEDASSLAYYLKKNVGLVKLKPFSL